jgi:hypothetical protein
MNDHDAGGICRHRRPNQLISVNQLINWIQMINSEETQGERKKERVDGGRTAPTVYLL